MGEDCSSLCMTASGQFRWLLLLRFTVALVVTVVAAVVVVRGLHLVLHPGNIELNISQGKVFMVRYGNNFTIRFYLQANNPSELIILYYRDITVQLFLNQSQQWLPDVDDNNRLATFDLIPSSLSLSQKEEQEYLVSGYAKNVTRLGVDQLSQNKSTASVVMVLNGTMAVANAKQPNINPTKHPATFYCRPVVVNVPSQKNNSMLTKPSSENLHNADCLQF